MHRQDELDAIDSDEEDEDEEEAVESGTIGKVEFLPFAFATSTPAGLEPASPELDEDDVAGPAMV